MKHYNKPENDELQNVSIFCDLQQNIIYFFFSIIFHRYSNSLYNIKCKIFSNETKIQYSCVCAVKTYPTADNWHEFSALNP